MKFFKYEGITPYAIALLDMQIAHENVLKGKTECVFIMEHEGLYSAGKSFETGDFIGTYPYKIYYSSRGGRVTVHNPGQLVIYPIINLKKRDINISSYVEMLEKWMMTVLSKFGIQAHLSDSGIGVWVNEAKIGFIGLRIEKGITTHGLCLNVQNDLEPFIGIIPCGINGVSITSMETVMNQKISMVDVIKTFIDNCPL